MSSPESTPDQQQPAEGAETQVSPANPAYSTPPPEGMPSADDQRSADSE
ncbi:MAG: hypothetical protein QOC76_5840 [Mycobacterium sp.]|jgi:hypothetical protein|nr:hypothetical protein [Mycobacterium sp.]